MKKNKTQSKKYWQKKRLMRVSRLLFLIYMLVTLYFVFFAEQMGRAAGSDYRYNLEPFLEIKRFLSLMDGEWKWSAWLNLAGNIFCFLPFGMFLPVICRSCRSFVRTTLMSAAFSLLIETIQLVFKIGIFDVDDLMLNTLGGMIGYIVYKIVMIFYHKRTV